MDPIGLAGKSVVTLGNTNVCGTWICLPFPCTLDNETHGAMRACRIHSGDTAINELCFRCQSPSCWATVSVMKEQAAPGSKNTLPVIAFPSGPVILALEVIKRTCFTSLAVERELRC